MSLSITVTLIRSLKRVEVSRQGKVFTSGLVYNMRHYRAVESRFKAWDKLGWPYEPKE
ncbi:hypothetical protein QGX21_gp059 [Pseudomonas phage phiPsa315]|uniref:Uncharacterized protein n=1 Tax=Pseudomonas phage phiPsa315 TaxID=1460363 RepID=A0A7G9V253_9CAUD|nr:hypothetical protein QGX21_gp059 [Pseudomonas phage phiPsa315]QNO00359.1 hypothetical protein phiPsa315_167 [Pseudomonas phage phiPsa315]